MKQPLKVHTVADVARLCHEMNRAWCELHNDTSQPRWEDAPDWQRQSIINGIEFHLAHPDTGPSGSHTNWMRVKRADGWEYGPVKDVEKKEHPCMVPFDLLPLHQRIKNSLFVTLVHGYAPTL